MATLADTIHALGFPKREGQKVKGLPCDICDKKHTYVVSHRDKKYGLLWDIHSPCLDQIAHEIVGTLNSMSGKE